MPQRQEEQPTSSVSHLEEDKQGQTSLSITRSVSQPPPTVLNPSKDPSLQEVVKDVKSRSESPEQSRENDTSHKGGEPIVDLSLQNIEGKTTSTVVSSLHRKGKEEVQEKESNQEKNTNNDTEDDNRDGLVPQDDMDFILNVRPTPIRPFESQTAAAATLPTTQKDTIDNTIPTPVGPPKEEPNEDEPSSNHDPFASSNLTSTTSSPVPMDPVLLTMLPNDIRHTANDVNGERTNDSNDADSFAFMKEELELETLASPEPEEELMDEEVGDKNLERILPQDEGRKSRMEEEDLVNITVKHETMESTRVEELQKHQQSLQEDPSIKLENSNDVEMDKIGRQDGREIAVATTGSISIPQSLVHDADTTNSNGRGVCATDQSDNGQKETNGMAMGDERIPLYCEEPPSLYDTFPDMEKRATAPKKKLKNRRLGKTRKKLKIALTFSKKNAVSRTFTAQKKCDLVQKWTPSNQFHVEHDGIDTENSMDFFSETHEEQGKDSMLSCYDYSDYSLILHIFIFMIEC